MEVLNNDERERENENRSRTRFAYLTIPLGYLLIFRVINEETLFICSYVFGQRPSELNNKISKHEDN